MPALASPRGERGGGTPAEPSVGAGGGTGGPCGTRMVSVPGGSLGREAGAQPGGLPPPHCSHGPNCTPKVSSTFTSSSDSRQLPATPPSRPPRPCPWPQVPCRRDLKSHQPEAPPKGRRNTSSGPAAPPCGERPGSDPRGWRGGARAQCLAPSALSALLLPWLRARSLGPESPARYSSPHLLHAGGQGGEPAGGLGMSRNQEQRALRGSG